MGGGWVPSIQRDERQVRRPADLLDDTGAMLLEPHAGGSRMAASTRLGETARLAWGTPWRSAAIAEGELRLLADQGVGSPLTHALDSPGSIASTLSRPKISPITIALASSGDAVGTRAQSGPSSFSGADSPGQNG